MNDQLQKQTTNEFDIFPVGHIRRKDGQTYLEILKPYTPALKHLSRFSHIRILWWCHRFQDDRFRRSTQSKPPYENAPVTGVFASRSPVRPNPLGLTTTEIIQVDEEEGLIEIANIDAFDDTPIIDLKPYIPSCDRVKDVKVPDWIAHWPDWMQMEDYESTVDPDHLRPAGIDCLAALQVGPPQSTSQQAMVEGGNLVLPSQPDARETKDIVIRGARQHNLKNIDVTIPHNKFVVITGVSGSGKSSLAFDTLYAEGQRRYMESLSTLARRLADQMEKPAVDHIQGLNPTVAIEQRTVTRNPRSTVGTITEVYDYLRLLFARLGTRHCPQCGRAVKPQTARQIAGQLAALPPGTPFQLLASDWMVDPLVVPDDPVGQQTEFHQHLFDVIETALKAGQGRLRVGLENGEDILLSQHNECPGCNLIFFELTPSLFSFNNPDGACSDCNGLGVKLNVDPSLIVTQPHLSLLDEASPWYGNLRQVKPSGNWMRSELFALADHLNVDLELPWDKLPEDFRQAALYGTGDEIISWRYHIKNRGRSIEFHRPVQGAVNNIKRLLQRTTSEGSRNRLLQFMSEQPCPTCQGERLCPEARFVTVGHMRFPQVATMTVNQARRWLDELPGQLGPQQCQIGGEILKELHARLQFMFNVGLHYLSLDRPAPTLSGGEGQRIRLGSQLGSGLTGLLYVLDEPSIGLHPRDHQPLLDTMRQLRDEGNTVVVVEHDANTMRVADWLIDLGPGAGIQGGQLIAAGTPAAVMADPDSLTGRYLSGAVQVTAANGKQRRGPDQWLTIFDARLHNLKGIDVRFPLGVMSCVTGVSGSGKSSLVAQTLSPALARALNGAPDVPGFYDRIEGLESVDKVVNITQAAIGRTPRSNPGTYVEVFDEIRKVFARTPEAKARGYKAGRFSFNAKGGRCEACQGYGRRRIEMHFLPDVWVACTECEGQRFNRHTLEIKYRTKSIAEVLDMDVQEALAHFSEHPKIVRILQTLHDVGLDYIKLGQSALTLSGGEAQRIKLAKELSRTNTGRTLYILDEPTTGLHFADVQKLLDVLYRLIEDGNTIIIIEHNLDVIKAADWVIDLGPDGGDAGGYVVAQGTPETVAQVKESYTGQFLRQVLA
jgi:excinuclease ABC subunit A